MRIESSLFFTHKTIMNDNVDTHKWRQYWSKIFLKVITDKASRYGKITPTRKQLEGRAKYILSGMDIRDENDQPVKTLTELERLL